MIIEIIKICGGIIWERVPFFISKTKPLLLVKLGSI